MLFWLESGELVGTYHNIGLLLSVEEVRSQIKIYTLHVEEGHRVVMAVDIIGKEESSKEDRVKCITIAAANLSL